MSLTTWLARLERQRRKQRKGINRRNLRLYRQRQETFGRVSHSAPRNGTGSPPGTLTTNLPPPPVPSAGNNAGTSSRSREAVRVVGRSGRSGIRKSDQPAMSPLESVADPITEDQA